MDATSRTCPAGHANANVVTRVSLTAQSSVETRRQIAQIDHGLAVGARVACQTSACEAQLVIGVLTQAVVLAGPHCLTRADLEFTVGAGVAAWT